MKNLLLYNYNMDIDDYTKIDNGICFYIDYDKYYFLKINRVTGDIEEIYNILNNYINSYHIIVKNKFGEIITKDDKTTYVLLKIKSAENEEIEVRDILLNQIPIDDSKSILRRDNWGILWGDKVDYLEYQVSELGKNHPVLLSSFSYYVGLAENAIEYFNNIGENKKILTLSQKRIKYPNIARNYYNPINLVIDSRTRDLAEYLKACFFENIDTIKQLEYITSKEVLSNYEYNLLYARLLYPSYYFDDIHEILEKGIDDDILLKYINKSSDYEIFLKDAYYLFSKKCEMIKIDWIINH